MPVTGVHVMSARDYESEEWAGILRMTMVLLAFRRLAYAAN